jgi:stearoyl-CoA desaturase (delta-9 desaturase)
MHVGCLAAPFFFTWQALAVAVVLHWSTCSIGICLGYHRFLSHRSLKLVAPVRFFVTLCGVLSGEGTPLLWAATHRLHHAKSDEPGDPHSPLDGPWWSHLLWLFVRHSAEHRKLMYKHFVPDLAQDRILLMFDKTYPLWLFGFAGLIYAIGGWPLLLWGVCVRMVIAYHSTWLVNSATHLWGYRNYETTDQSRNLWWVAILAYGEGWHNNHHAYPAFARAGHKWWEVDMTWYAIKVLRALGLAYEVDDRLPSASAATAPTP